MWKYPLCVLPAGDPVHRGGLQAAGTHGLPRGSAPADGSLLAEGAQQAASLPRHPQLPGQAHPQPQQPPDAGGGRAQVGVPANCGRQIINAAICKCETRVSKIITDVDVRATVSFSNIFTSIN